MENYNIKNFKKKLIGFIFLLLFAAGLVWFFNYGFVEINVPNHDGQDIQYVITDSSGRSKSFDRDGGSFKKLLKRGQYQVTVLQEQENQNFFAAADVPGLLRTAKLDAALNSEKAVSFVGDNPLACINYAGILVSAPCQANIERLQAHQPATANTPSATRQFNSLIFSGFTIDDYLRVDGEIFLLASLSVHDQTIVGLYPLDPGRQNINQNRGVILTEYTDNRSYRAARLDQGFMLFSEDGQQFLRFDSLSDNSPEELQPPAPEDSNLNLYSADSANGSIVLTYSSGLTNELGGASFFPSLPEAAPDQTSEFDEGDVFSPDAVEETGGKSEVIIMDGEGGQAKSLSFDFSPDQVRLCAENVLCVLDQGVLEFYDTAGESPERLYTMDGVIQVATDGNRLLLVKNDGIVDFDPLDQSGYYHYFFGQYVFCGIQPVGGSYLVCVNDGTDSNRARHVLLIDPSQDLTDQIDKQVLELIKMPETISVAPYGNFIHISPNVGRLVVDQETGDLEYSPEVIANINQAINDKVEELGINLERYNIINPFDD